MSRSAELCLVAPASVVGIWLRVEPLLRPAMERCGEMPLADLYGTLVSGRFRLWLAVGEHIEAAAVTEIAETTAGRVLCIVAVGGRDRSRWVHMRAQLEQHGRQAGCVISRIYGRCGWARVMPDYRIARLVLEKEL